jgi:hypothetical protein
VVKARDGYQQAWQRVSERMQTLGGRAWMFRSADEPDRHIEFLEWKQSADGANMIADAELEDALNRLDGFGTGRTETWVEP